MSEVPLLIPDASPALRWVLPNRDLSLEANDLLADVAGGRVNLLAPYHFPVEVAGGIRRQAASHKMPHLEAKRRLDQFLATRIPSVDEPGLLQTAFDNCQHYSISLRDALYVTLAQFYQAPLVTADENLLRAVRRFPLAIFLGEYESPRR